MGERYLIDSNVIIDLCNAKLPVHAQELIFLIAPEISIITNIELFAIKNITEQETELLKRFVSISKIYPVGADLITTTINIRQNYKIKLPDAIIAATALQNGLIILTRNTKDFLKINDLKVVNPYEL